MGAMQLPDHLRDVIDRQVAEGRAPSADAYLEAAVWRYAEDLEAEDEIRAIAHAGIADIEAGRFATVASPQDAEALHRRAMRRVRAQLAGDASEA